MPHIRRDCRNPEMPGAYVGIMSVLFAPVGLGEKKSIGLERTYTTMNDSTGVGVLSSTGSIDFRFEMRPKVFCL